MAFNPTSTIYLCNVPIDNTYKHQIYFYDQSGQERYFSARVQKTFSNYLTVRKTDKNGGLISSVKVDANIETLYGCNYMYYQNANHSARYFYAFITNLIYINEGTTEIQFETDVYQTWLFYTEMQESYVVREHSVTDKRGDNVVPESFNFQDFVYTKYPDGVTGLGDYGYLVASTEPYNDTGTDEYKNDRGKEVTNIYQGLHFYFFKRNSGKLQSFMENVDKDCIVSISVVPEFNVGSNSIGIDLSGEGMILYHAGLPEKEYSFVPSTFKDFEGYTPKNNKLFTNPFFKMIVTNNSGQEAEYTIEDFSDPDNIKFKLYGDISVSPSVTLIPQNYKGVSEHYTAGISIKSFPQCSFNADTFKLWLAKNQYSTAIGAAGGIGSIIGGVALLATGAGVGAGVGMIAGGAAAVANTANNVYQASQEPNRGQTGSIQNNLLTAMGRNKFDFYVQQIKREYAETIDNFFTMYGYATNRLKKPNLSSRPYFNYIQTIDCNIRGSIPADDMRRLKMVYNNGVTLWKPTATVGDYAVDNSPS